MTAVHSALARRFPSPEWATFFEVRDDAGFKARRSADVVAMNTWPSRGLAIHGVEVKVERSDWLREKKDPAKSASIQRFCDYWWLAVADDKVAKVEEVPETWGLLVLRGKSLVSVKAAPKLEAAPLERGFIASILRHASDGVVPKSEVDEMVAERVAKRLESERSMGRGDAEADKVALRELRQQVAAFERASGIRIGSPYEYGDMRDPTKLGAAVRLLLDRQSGLNPDRLTYARNQVEDLLRDLTAAIDVVSALHPKPTAEVA